MIRKLAEFFRILIDYEIFFIANNYFKFVDNSI